jgi:hypothetical protein
MSEENRADKGGHTPGQSRWQQHSFAQINRPAGLLVVNSRILRQAHARRILVCDNPMTRKPMLKAGWKAT